MKERPILFSAPMVRAILSDQKTQTRRAVKITHRTPGLAACLEPPAGMRTRPSVAAELCPYGQPGDRLWVRETWAGSLANVVASVIPAEVGTQRGMVAYRATYASEGCPFGKWRPSIHMPRWASRISLEIASVRVERLQAISEADARAEGIDYDPGEGGVFHVPGLSGCCSDSAAGSFQRLWETINGAESWNANPWVWAVEFKRLEA